MTTPTKLRRFDAADYLNTPSDIAHYLQAALDEKDPAFFSWRSGLLLVRTACLASRRKPSSAVRVSTRP
jgi:DNA-binding phage protein